MNLNQIYKQCLSDIGGESNQDIRWYLHERPKIISRKNFFEQTVWAIWVSGKSRKAAEAFLKHAEESGYVCDFNNFGSWDRRHLRHFMEKLHGRPVPEQAYKRWQSLYDISKELRIYSNEDDFRNSFFGGKLKSADLDKSDVQNIITRRFPFIRNANASFILRNMGGEFIKCDRWLDVFIRHYKISLDELEKRIQRLNIPLGLFDVVIWAYCENFVGNTNEFDKHLKKVFA